MPETNKKPNKMFKTLFSKLEKSMAQVVNEVVSQVKAKPQKPKVKSAGVENEVRDAELLYEICLPSPPR